MVFGTLVAGLLLGRVARSVLAERVGWTGSISWFRERVRAIRPEYLPADPVDRLEYLPGRAIQCDLCVSGTQHRGRIRPRRSTSASSPLVTCHPPDGGEVSTS